MPVFVRRLKKDRMLSADGILLYSLTALIEMSLLRGDYSSIIIH